MREVLQSISLVFYKPYGVLSCFTDPAGRSTLADFIRIPAVYPAGRLDFDSEGLLLLTADGSLSRRLTHPRYKLPKTYLVQIEGIPHQEALARLQDGILIKERRTRQAIVQLLREPPVLPPRPVPIRFRKSIPTCWLKITIREGFNRQIRRMTAAAGYPTLRLVRVAIGPISVGNLQPGQWRQLRAKELRVLRASQ